MTHTFETRIVSLGDDELVRLVTVDAAQYRQEALDIARTEASRRNLALDAAVPEPEPSDRSLGDAIRALRQGVGAQLGPASFIAAERIVTCPHCASQSFEEHPALVNTRGLTFLGLDWLNKGATVLVCGRCGLLQWFGVAPSRAPR